MGSDTGDTTGVGGGSPMRPLRDYPVSRGIWPAWIDTATEISDSLQDSRPPLSLEGNAYGTGATLGASDVLGRNGATDPLVFTHHSNGAFPIFSLGQPGQFYRSPVWEAPSGLDWRYREQELAHWAQSPEKLGFRDARSPYSDLFYLQGGKGTQVFQAEHTRPVGANWLGGLNYHRLQAPGRFAQQETNHTGLEAWAWYRAPAGRYGLRTATQFQKFVIQENGGIVSDTFFTTSNGLNPEFEQVRLSGAFHRRYQRYYWMTHWWAPAGLDSRWGRLVQHVQLNSADREYEDLQAQGRYNSYFYDSARTFDRVEFRVWKHQLAWETQNRFWATQLGLINEHIDLRTGSSDLPFLRHRGYLAAQVFQGPWSLHGRREQYLGGEQDGFSERIGLEVRGTSLRAQTGLIREERPIDAFYVHWYGNHQEWGSGLWTQGLSGSTSRMGWDSRVSWKYEDWKVETGALVQEIRHLPLISAGGRPLSLNALNHGRVHGRVQHEARNWALQLGGLWQDHEQSALLLGVPPWLLQAEGVLKFRPIKGALDLRVGADALHHPEFTPYGYIPELAAFTYGGGEALPAFTYTSVFMHARIKRALVTIKFSNLLESWLYTGYYTYPHYPMRGRSFDLQLRWRFFD